MTTGLRMLVKGQKKAAFRAAPLLIFKTFIFLLRSFV
jgi:hypothetical protein